MAVDSLSGNTMSKLTIKSPRLAGSLGLGRPFPTTRLTVEGLMTSSWRFKANRSPPNSGTETCDPHKAWKEKRNNSNNSGTYDMNRLHIICIYRDFLQKIIVLNSIVVKFSSAVIFLIT